MAHWLSWKCAISRSTAREQLGVAKRISVLPAITAEFGAGRLSYSKARALVRVATPDTEAELVELARCSTAEQLERLLSAFALVVEGASADAQHLAHQRRGLRCRATRRATFVVTAEMTEHDYKVFMTRLGELEADVPPDTVIDANDPAAARRLDALVRMAEGPEPAQLNLYTPLDLADVFDAPAPEPKSASADALFARERAAKRRRAAAYLRTMGAEARIALDIDHHGVSIDLGRSRRHPSRRLRRAVLRRDRYRCRWAACDHKAEHVHHIVAWIDGGPTDLVNLVGLCRYHHRLVHHGGWRIVGDPTNVGELAFTDGARVVSERPDPPRDAAPAGLRGFPTADLQTTIYDPLHLDIALTALVGLLGVRATSAAAAETRPHQSVGR